MTECDICHRATQWDVDSQAKRETRGLFRWVTQRRPSMTHSHWTERLYNKGFKGFSAFTNENLMPVFELPVIFFPPLINLWNLAPIATVTRCKTDWEYYAMAPIFLSNLIQSNYNKWYLSFWCNYKMLPMQFQYDIGMIQTEKGFLSSSWWQ